MEVSEVAGYKDGKSLKSVIQIRGFKRRYRKLVRTENDMVNKTNSYIRFGNDLATARVGSTVWKKNFGKKENI